MVLLFLSPISCLSSRRSSYALSALRKSSSSLSGPASTTTSSSTDGNRTIEEASVVICGPSGAGKGTLIHRLLTVHPQTFALSVSHTSRGPRPGEIDGFHYHFRSLDYIQKDIQSGAIPYLEHANVHGNLYGTRLDAVQVIHQRGKICVLDVDVNGVKQIKAKQFPAKYIFIRPPSLDDLEHRLRGRNTETEKAIQTRLHNARLELEYGASFDDKGKQTFDKVIVNGDLEVAWKELEHTISTWFPTFFTRDSSK
eukprot:gene1896-2075_t